MLYNIIYRTLAESLEKPYTYERKSSFCLVACFSTSLIMLLKFDLLSTANLISNFFFSSNSSEQRIVAILGLSLSRASSPKLCPYLRVLILTRLLIQFIPLQPLISSWMLLSLDICNIHINGSFQNNVELIANRPFFEHSLIGLK